LSVYHIRYYVALWRNKSIMVMSYTHVTRPQLPIRGHLVQAFIAADNTYRQIGL